MTVGKRPKVIVAIDNSPRSQLEISSIPPSIIVVSSTELHDRGTYPYRVVAKVLLCPGVNRSCPETGVNGAGRRFCFETYQVIEER
ncbi:hypothetical protein, partial [Mycobacterium nebraskense]|uniref:hypothetical protein n=1 Tax=Mycobacterium nebraskense TaxID=244292 RepID=UPI001ABF5710